MKTTEIRELSVAELIERIAAEKDALAKAKINHAVSPAENSTTMRKMRRNIARMLTILGEKQS